MYTYTENCAYRHVICMWRLKFRTYTILLQNFAEVIQNHENVNVHIIGQGEAQHTRYKKLKLGGGQAYDRSSVLSCYSHSCKYILRIMWCTKSGLTGLACTYTCVCVYYTYVRII